MFMVLLKMWYWKYRVRFGRKWGYIKTGFILKIKEQIPKFSQTFFKDFYRLLPGKYLKRVQKEWFEKWYLD